MNVLVLGGAGYVGSACVEQLLETGNRVVVVDNLATGHRAAVDEKAVFVEADFVDSGLIARLIHEHRIDGAMHFAGETLVENSMTDPRPYFQNNLIKGIKLLDTLLSAGVERLIFSSTAATYGEPQFTPITEEHPTAPINAYGESKLMFEKVLKWYERSYGLRYVAVRYFNAAGSTERVGEDHHPESHLLPRLLNSILDPAEPFTIYGNDYPTSDGTCVRDYVHVSDIAQAHILAMQALREGVSGVFNIGSGTGYSVKEVVQTVEHVTGTPLPIRIGPRRLGDPAVLVASNEKMCRELQWRPKCSSLREIVESAWRWKQNHPTGYTSLSEVAIS